MTLASDVQRVSGAHTWAPYLNMYKFSQKTPSLLHSFRKEILYSDEKL